MHNTVQSRGSSAARHSDGGAAMPGGATRTPIATCTTFNDPFLWWWVIQLNAPRAVVMSYAAAATAHHADHNPSRIYDSFAISSDRQDNLRTRNVWLAEQRSPSRQDFLLRRKGRFSIKRLLALKEAVLGTVP